MRSRLLCLATGCWLVLAACISVAGGPGGISPSQFEFIPEVPLRGKGPGGWKVARVVISLLRVADKPDLVTCHLLIEVPQVNREGAISDEVAQLSAAASADAAAAKVAGLGYTSAELCHRFKEEMLRELQLRIPGARVRLNVP
jgi:hypothetical protein